ncbi:NACHT domain protein [Maioricimonas rarisocia]|uniref:NACHT domain protein n=1 Tax=Maioricimonas rarisocia TaxID=2528026 RepID=A0A517Z3C5_9PLAN|nr:ATP-binding protein [Maioricimonas rarisocia]QDU36927.1 NACHT domain protein [Maioricimonas rarisocia]
MKARDNPFRIERVLTLRYRFLAGSWQELLDRLERQNGRGAIVGPHGSGKTTLMDELATHLEQRGSTIHRCRFNLTDHPATWTNLRTAVRDIPEDALLLLDGAEQLGPLQWHWLMRRSRHLPGLVITTHRPGRLPTLIDCHTTPQLFADLVEQLAPGTFSAEELRQLFDHHAGNLRLCLRELYDRMAMRKDDRAVATPSAGGGLTRDA